MQGKQWLESLSTIRCTVRMIFGSRGYFSSLYLELFCPMTIFSTVRNSYCVSKVAAVSMAPITLCLYCTVLDLWIRMSLFCSSGFFSDSSRFAGVSSKWNRFSSIWPRDTLKYYVVPSRRSVKLKICSLPVHTQCVKLSNLTILLSGEGLNDSNKGHYIKIIWTIIHCF